MTPETRTAAPLAVGVAILALAFAAALVRTGPPPPRGVDAPPDAFSAGRAAEVLRALVGDGVPHPIGSEANARVRARILDALRNLGYEPEVQTTFACSGTDRACGFVHNVLAIREGRENGPVVLVASHYDSVAAGPGASDAGVSVAAILEVARALTAEPPRRNRVAFLVDDGEEAGLLGASGFVADHPLAREIGAVVNLEARGTSGASVMFETSGPNAWLVAALARSLARPVASSLFYPIYERLPNDTDLTIFKQAGTAGVNFAFIGSVPHYHTPLDRVDHASPASLQHQGENALAIVRALADADLAAPPGGDTVFFDVLAFAIVRWPVELMQPLAWIALGLVVVATAGMRLRSGVPLWRGIAGLVVWALMVAAAAGATWGLLRWMTTLGVWPGGGTTAPQTSVLAFWLTGIAAASFLGAVFVRLVRGAGAWTGCWLGWAGSGAAAALYFPEASYVLVVPALVAGAAGLISLARVTDTPGPARALGSALPLATAAALLMPPAWLLFDALGPPALPVAGTAIGLVSTGLWPLLARADGARWLVPMLAVAGAATCAALAYRAPAWSPERPERMSIAFLQMEGDPRARWIVSPQSGTLPDALRVAAPFGRDREVAYPWSPATAFVAAADPTGVAGPALEGIERGVRDGRRLIRMRAYSPRGAPVLSIVVPRARVVSVEMNGRAVPDQRTAAGGALVSYTCHAVPHEGVQITLVIDGDELLDGFLLDRSYTLPPAGNALKAARPTTAQPFGSGEVTVLARRVTL